MVPRSYPDTATGAMKPATCYAHACTVADVEVDDETGEVTVLAIKNIFEIGRALNPKMVEQQLVGGSWMGMSHALYETTEPYYPNRDFGGVDFNEYLMPGPGDPARPRSSCSNDPRRMGPMGPRAGRDVCKSVDSCCRQCRLRCRGCPRRHPSDHARAHPACLEGTKGR